jgi:3'(2'), 5'-bisphosphate nucleotidase
VADVQSAVFSMNDLDFASWLARGAGEILSQLRQRSTMTGKQLGYLGDIRSSEFLMARLAELRPEDGVLCEESVDSPDRLNKNRVWIIDPLDGTREFCEGRTDWAVHVALAINGEALVGAVALPALDLIHLSKEPSYIADRHVPARMLVSRTRPSPHAVAVAERLGATLVPMGSAGAKAMAVVRGEAEIYLHSGGQYEWDNCAPAAVAAAAGLHVSRLDGSPLRYNNRSPWLPDLLICNHYLAPAVLAALRDHALPHIPLERPQPFIASR